MASFARRSRSLLMFPLIILVFIILEEIAMYKIRQHVADVRIRTGIIVFFYGFGITMATVYLAPWLRGLLDTMRKSSQVAGTIGLILFYLAAYAAVYYAFYVMETQNAGFLLPAAYR